MFQKTLRNFILSGIDLDREAATGGAETWNLSMT